MQLIAPRLLSSESGEPIAFAEDSRLTGNPPEPRAAPCHPPDDTDDLYWPVTGHVINDDNESGRKGRPIHCKMRLKRVGLSAMRPSVAGL